MASDDSGFDPLEDARDAIRESISYLSNAHKQDRELWVAETFLKNANVAFNIEEISVPEDDPPDVVFRDARFEIKAILDPGRRMHREYVEALSRAEQASEFSELLESFHPEYISLADVHDKVLSTAQEQAGKYAPSVLARLDLLCYVNLTNVMGINPRIFPETSTLATLGWRSVQFVCGHVAGVFYCSAGAPDILRSLEGKLMTRRHAGA